MGLLLPDGSKSHGGVCHNVTFTTVGLRLGAESGAWYFALLMGIGFGPPWECIQEVVRVYTRKYDLFKIVFWDT